MRYNYSTEESLKSVCKMAQQSSLVFKVRRQQPELITPARPTTHECKLLSDIDDQRGLRHHAPAISFYRHNSTVMKGRDPVKVIRDAIAKTLVFYYPLAGRLREGPGRKLVVDCTGEGIIFIEADADVTLTDFGDPLLPPIPCMDELLYFVPGSGRILHCPLALIQITRLKCGGFICATRVNHVMGDAAGVIQFVTAIGEVARGASAPSIMPVWQRHRLNARDEPRVTCTHNEYVEVADDKKATIIRPLEDLANRSFFFGRTEISALRRFVPPHLSKCTTSDVLSASIWRCHTISLHLDPEEEVRLLYPVNTRSKFTPPLSPGFYGNSIAFPVALTTAGKLSQNPLGYAMELIMKVKSDATEEYMKSVADLMVTRGRPVYNAARALVLSDVRHAGTEKVDFGWGKAIYYGPPKGGAREMPGLSSYLAYLVSFKDKNGENGIMVPLSLPTQAMKTFEHELGRMLNGTVLIDPAITK